MKTFKEFFTEAIFNPTDLGIFHNVIDTLRDVVEDYKSPKSEYKDEIDHGEGIGYEFFINFKGTPFENLGKRKLWVNIRNLRDKDYAGIYFDDQIIDIGIDYLISEYPYMTTLEHELIHYFQDLNRKILNKPWGTAPKSVQRKYKNAALYKNKPVEYLPNLNSIYNMLRNNMIEHGITKQELIDFMLYKNDSLKHIWDIRFVRHKLNDMRKRNPEVGRRYIKKLYTNL